MIQMFFWALALYTTTPTRLQSAELTPWGHEALRPVSWLGGAQLQAQMGRVLRERLKQYPIHEAERLAGHLLALCKDYVFQPALILALIDTESSFRVRAVSPVGARGLMQVMPGTAEHVAEMSGIPYRGLSDLDDPYQNLLFGVRYLAYLRGKYGMETALILAAYNAGPARVDRFLKEKGRLGPRVTAEYIKKIGERFWSYRAFLEGDAGGSDV